MMTTTTTTTTTRWAWTACVLLAAVAARAADVKVTPLKPGGIYELGERAGWTVSGRGGGGGGAGRVAFTVKQNNHTPIKSGELDLSGGDATVDVTLNEPAMLYLEIKPVAGGNGNGTAKPLAVAGAAVAPTKLQPVAKRPADFDEFWEAKVTELKKVPANPVLTPKDAGGTPGVDYAIIRMDHVDGGKVHGQFAKPKKAGKFPALVIFQWASPPYPLEKGWVLPHAQKGWLTLNIEPHDVLPDEPRSYYDALPKELKNYHTIGMADRDKSYFLQMYLRDYRAVDYVTSRDDWDGKTLVVMGTSMGGQQSLCVAGLHPKITHVIVNEPAGCDMNAPLHGRQSGYPFFPGDNAEVMETSLYFDPINFAPRIKATSLVGIGFVDRITPPAGIWTAFNQIKAPKEAVPLVDSPHNHLATPAQQEPIVRRTQEWLDALVKGETVEPKQTPAAAASR